MLGKIEPPTQHEHSKSRLLIQKGHSLSGEHSRGCASRECVQSSFKSDNEETVSFANNLCCKSDLCNSQTTLHSNQIILACLLALALIC